MNELALVAAWCIGYTEVPLSDNTRVDCLTETHAWEADYGPKWAEAIGQSLHYARMTGKQPGIVLIAPSEAQLERVQRIVYHYQLPITVEVLEE